jgi:hypothetical protein
MAKLAIILALAATGKAASQRGLTGLSDSARDDGERFCERSDWSNDKAMCNRNKCCDWAGSDLGCMYDLGSGPGGANPVCDTDKVNRKSFCTDYKVNDAEWRYYAGDNGRQGCDWVEKKPETRCSRIGDGLVPAKDACCAACKDFYGCDFEYKGGKCEEVPEEKQCEDDADWRYWAGDKGRKGCAHIRKGNAKEQGKRCDRPGADGINGNVACPLTCNTCDGTIASLVAVEGPVGEAYPLAKFAALTAAVALTALAAMAGAKAKRSHAREDAATAKTPLINSEEPYQTPLYTL